MEANGNYKSTMIYNRSIFISEDFLYFIKEFDIELTDIENIFKSILCFLEESSIPSNFNNHVMILQPTNHQNTNIALGTACIEPVNMSGQLVESLIIMYQNQVRSLSFNFHGKLIEDFRYALLGMIGHELVHATMDMTLNSIQTFITNTKVNEETTDAIAYLSLEELYPLDSLYLGMNYLSPRISQYKKILTPGFNKELRKISKELVRSFSMKIK